MAVRQFDGIDDDIRHTVGSTLADMAYGTVALLFKPQPPIGDWHAPLTIAYDDRSTSANFYIYEDGNNAYLGIWSERAGDGDEIQLGPFNRWYLAVVYKEPTVGPAHISFYDYVTGQWTHDNTKNFWEWWAVGPDGIIQRSDTDAADGGHFRGLIAVQAMWVNRVPLVATENIEAAGLEESLQAWFDAEPDALWTFNQGSVNDPVDDLVGDADQIARVGTAVVTNDDPPGFDWGTGEAVSIEATPVSAIGAVQSVLTAISQAVQSVPVLGSFLAQPVSPSSAALNVPAVPSLLSGAVQPVSPTLDAKSIVSVPVLTSGDVQPVLPVMGAFSLEAAPALGQGNVQPLQLALTDVGIPAAPVVANGDAIPTLLDLGELRFASLSASLIGSSQPVLIRGGVVTIQAETIASSLVALAGQLSLGSLSVDAVPVLGKGEVRTVQPVISEEPTLVTAEVAGVTGLSVPADVLLSPFSLLATPVQGLAAPQPVAPQLAEKLIAASPAKGQAIASPIDVSLSELRIPGLPADASLQGMPTLIILDGKIIALVPADGVAEAVAMVVRSSELLIQAVVNARFARQEAEGSFNRTVVPTRFGRIIVLGYKEPD